MVLLLPPHCSKRSTAGSSLTEIKQDISDKKLRRNVNYFTYCAIVGAHNLLIAQWVASAKSRIAQKAPERSTYSKHTARDAVSVAWILQFGSFCCFTGHRCRSCDYAVPHCLLNAAVSCGGLHNQHWPPRQGYQKPGAASSFRRLFSGDCCIASAHKTEVFPHYCAGEVVTRVVASYCGRQSAGC